MGRYIPAKSPDTRIKLHFERGLFCEEQEENKEFKEKVLAGGFVDCNGNTALNPPTRSLCVTRRAPGKPKLLPSSTSPSAGCFGAGFTPPITKPGSSHRVDGPAHTCKSHPPPCIRIHPK